MPSIRYNPEAKGWEIKGSDNKRKMFIGDSGVTYDVEATATYGLAIAVASLTATDTVTFRLGSGGRLDVGTIVNARNVNIAANGSIANFNSTAATITGLNVGTLATIAYLVNTQGTITNVSVGTLATLRAVNVAGTGSLATANIANLINTAGTITGLNVGTLATIGYLVNTQGTVTNVNVGTLATIQKAAVAQIAFAGANTFTYIGKFVGTIPLTNVGTFSTAVVTLAHVGTCAVGDSVLVSPKSALITGLLAPVARIPSANTINLDVTNILADSVGSQPAIGVDVTILR